MTVTDVAWRHDIHRRPVLTLTLDGRPAYIHSGQRTDLTRHGLLEGIVFLASERSSQAPSDFVKGDFRPMFDGLDLVGCTDDPEVFTLYQEMCAAISAGTWREGSRPASA